MPAIVWIIFAGLGGAAATGFIGWCVRQRWFWVLAVLGIILQAFEEAIGARDGHTSLIIVLSVTCIAGIAYAVWPYVERHTRH